MFKARLTIPGTTFILLFSLFSIETHALPKDYQAYPTDPELKSLPSYCTVRLRHGDYKDPLYQKALASFGPDFEHVHHYCSGLNLMNRYYKASDAEDKKFFLKSAIGEFNYMTSHAKAEFTLMPEIHLNRGVVYSLMKQDFQALTDIAKALELNPRMVKGYHLLAELYEKNIKQKPKALEVVTVGLQHNPDSKTLQSRYLELGGKLPYPEPLQQTMPEKTKEPAQEKASITEEKSSTDNSSAPPPAATTPESSTDQSNIGSPSNPYCRFCTD